VRLWKKSCTVRAPSQLKYSNEMSHDHYMTYDMQTVVNVPQSPKKPQVKVLPDA